MCCSNVVFERGVRAYEEYLNHVTHTVVGTQVPNTWHTTMLAEIGENKEGPLPWVERDYTPTSTAKDWERGKMDLLVKVYPDGLATNWLLGRKVRDDVFFSKPIRTMNVPSLVTNDARQAGFYPDSVLLLLAGTGIVSLPQILHHRDPIRKLGLSTPKHYQLHVPIDLIASFREDDALYINEIAEHCRRDELRNCTLLLTNKKSSQAPPFKKIKIETPNALMKDLKNVCILIYCIFVSKRISITHTHSNTGTCLEATIESRTCVKIRESYAQTMSYRDQWSEQFQLCMS